VPSSENERENGKHLDYRLGRPHLEKPKNRVLPRGGALILDSEGKKENAWKQSWGALICLSESIREEVLS
jgi:hypothetical protein